MRGEATLSRNLTAVMLERVAPDLLMEKGRCPCFFGIIESAALSPELVQPLVKLVGFSLDEQWSKVIGLVAAMAAVTAFLVVTHYGLKLVGRLVKFLRG